MAYDTNLVADDKENWDFTDYPELHIDPYINDDGSAVIRYVSRPTQMCIYIQHEPP